MKSMNLHQKTMLQANGNRFSMWHLLGDIILSELYMDFCPRFFKKKGVEVQNYNIKAAIAWLAAVWKLSMGIVACLLLITYDFAHYEWTISILAIYLTLDGFYQAFDCRYPYTEGLRRAATLLVDMISWPFYFIRLLQARSVWRGRLTPK